MTYFNWFFHKFFYFWKTSFFQFFEPSDSAADMMSYEKQLLTVYEYFSDNGNIQSGLVADDRDWFKLNGKKFRIFSGSLHYFRIHPDHWRDRMRKYRAAGLNAIDVWVNVYLSCEIIFSLGLAWLTRLIQLIIDIIASQT